MVRPTLDRGGNREKNHTGVGTGLKPYRSGNRYKTKSHGCDPFPCAPVEIWVYKTCSLHGPRGKLGIEC